MAQAVKKENVGKNCIDVEKIIMESLSVLEREDDTLEREPMKIRKLSKELSHYASQNNSSYNHGLVHINQLKQKLVYRDRFVYNR
ncbi:MAG: hypothetical protein ACFFDF_03570 [Candidatus Odinarchaeota archaeon]